MRSLPLISCATLLLAANAGAQEQHYPLTEPGVARVEITAPAQRYHFLDYEAEAISGAYAMSNGWRMKVDTASDGIVAQIDKQRPFRLVAVSQDQYISPDGNISMEFNRGRRGDDVWMRFVPDMRTAPAATLARR